MIAQMKNGSIVKELTGLGFSTSSTCQLRARLEERHLLRFHQESRAGDEGKGLRPRSRVFPWQVKLSDWTANPYGVPIEPASTQFRWF